MLIYEKILVDHPDISSMACEAAGKQERYWEMHDFLFEAPQDAANDTMILNFARLLKLNVPQFKADLLNKELEDKLIKQKELLTKQNIWKVPTVVLNGEILTDLPSINKLDKLLTGKTGTKQ